MGPKTQLPLGFVLFVSASFSNQKDGSWARFQPAMLASDDFVEEVISCWGIGTRFSQLAETITPSASPRDATDIRLVEDAMEELAERVWGMHGFSLTLMGSCLSGTDILKQFGQSDRDYALRKLGNDTSISMQEWRSFLSQMKTNFRFQEVALGRKAIKFRDSYLKLDWEVVPLQGHFSYDLVTYPTLEGTTDTERRNDLRSEFYMRHPGAKNAVKVVKRLCPSFDGNTVEALICRVGKEYPGLAEDPTGLMLFEHLIMLFYNYPWDWPNSPLSLLRQDAAKYGRQQHIEKTLQDARRIASVIKDRTTCQEPTLQIPLWVGERLIALIGLLAGAFMTWFVATLVSSSHAPSAFSQFGCPGNSCFCTDCRESWFTCARKDFSCRMLGIPLNRCSITFSATCATIGVHFIITASALSALKDCARRLKQQSVSRISLLLSTMSLPFVVIISFMVFAYHVHFFAVGDFRVVVTLARNLINMLSLAISGAVFIGVWDAYAIGETRTHIKRLGYVFVLSFVIFVIFAELLRTISMSRDGKSEIDFRIQNHLFYAVALALQLCLAFISWLYAQKQFSKATTTLLWVQVCWMGVEIYYLMTAHLWPVVNAQYDLLVGLCSRLILVRKLVAIVGLCCPPQSQSRRLLTHISAC